MLICLFSFIGNLLVQPGLNGGMASSLSLFVASHLKTAIAKCITAASNNDGAAVTLQGCTGADSQNWVFNNGQVRVFGNKCLDVTNGANNDGTKLQIWTCFDGSVNQLWDYTVCYLFLPFLSTRSLNTCFQCCSGGITT